MTTRRLFASVLGTTATRHALMAKQARFWRTTAGFEQQANSSRQLHVSAPALKTIELVSFEDLENYFANKSNRLAMFDFYNDANGISMMQSLRLQSKIKCSDVEVDLVRVDLQSGVELADYFQVDSAPTLISFVDSEIFEQIEGSVDDEKLDDAIQSLIEQTHNEY